MPSIYSKGLKWGTTTGSPWPSLVVLLMREERAPRLLLKLCIQWQSFWKQIAHENQGLGILLMHQNNCQHWTHMSTWQPVARGQQLLTLIEAMSPDSPQLPIASQYWDWVSAVFYHLTLSSLVHLHFLPSLGEHGLCNPRSKTIV